MGIVVDTRLGSATEQQLFAAPVAISLSVPSPHVGAPHALSTLWGAS